MTKRGKRQCQRAAERSGGLNRPLLTFSGHLLDSRVLIYTMEPEIWIARLGTNWKKTSY